MSKQDGQKDNSDKTGKEVFCGIKVKHKADDKFHPIIFAGKRNYLITQLINKIISDDL